MLVNDQLHGGTGGSNVAAVTNGPTMMETLMHELGHAQAALTDEYDWGVSESRARPMKNCWAGSAAGAAMPDEWAKWVAFAGPPPP